MPLLILEFGGLLLTLLCVTRLMASVISSKVRAQMAAHPNIHAVWFVFVVLFQSGCLGGPLGYVTARSDLWRGAYRLHGAEINAPLEGKKIYCRLLRERYGLSCSPVRGCIRSTNMRNYERAYNDEMKAGVTKHFGRDVVAECERDAMNEWLGSADDRIRRGGTLGTWGPL